MKKTKKLFSILVCVLISALVVFACVACNNEVTDKYISDVNTYRWGNTPRLQPEVDEGVKIDGEFDDPVYENIRWLEAVDRPDSEKSSVIRIGTAITAKGLYIAIDVEETGSKIYVNPTRGDYLNSGIELHIELAGETYMTQKALEINCVANGEYAVRSRVPNRGSWRDVATPDEIAPLTAAKAKGGKLNSDACYGYTYEAFFSKWYLEKIGYKFSEDMEFVLNPVHIISLDYNLTNNLARIYSEWMKNYSAGYNWNIPGSWLIFGKNGLQAYDVKTTISGDASLGTVMSANGNNGFFKGQSGQLKILRFNNSTLTKLVVDGKDSLDKVVWTGDIGYLTVSNPTADVVVEAEFSK